MHNSGTMHTNECFIVIAVTWARRVSQRDYEKAVNVISVDSHAHKYTERNRLSATIWKILRRDEQLHKGRFHHSAFYSARRKGFRLIKFFFRTNNWRNCAVSNHRYKRRLLKHINRTFFLQTNWKCHDERTLSKNRKGDTMKCIWEVSKE